MVRPSDAVAQEGWGTEFLRQSHLHNPGVVDWQSSLTVAGYIRRCSTMHILPIIQSVIIRCMYSWNIYKQLMSPIGSLVPQLVKNPPALWETWV